ncbi:sulfur carrier protein ThiS [Pantoea sp. Aalb]|uniref:sulfur carrier protein ThiS n=1 Tax=Pantoea sp. Aalb TaxID=2576762 RepID=UPI00132A8D11|nr:sulfur carrier protein ThiS [Pantoea sp. Aalb]MXP67992.1 sulfur carrier protein ThiS [Pantoea sp. Aalb]
MKVYFNGQIITTQTNNLKELLNQQKIDLNAIATAVNGTFIPKNKYDKQILEEGYQIEVLSPMQGG